MHPGPLQENANRLKAYKSKLVVFPRNKKKVKQGDSSSEEQQAAAQLTGRVLPLVHEKPAVEFVTISEEMKVGWLHAVCNASSCMGRTPGCGSTNCPPAAGEGVCDATLLPQL